MSPTLSVSVSFKDTQRLTRDSETDKALKDSETGKVGSAGW